MRVASNKCKDHLKSAWVRRVQSSDDDTLPLPRGEPPDAAPTPEAALLSNVQSQLFRAKALLRQQITERRQKE